MVEDFIAKNMERISNDSVRIIEKKLLIYDIIKITINVYL